MAIHKFDKQDKKVEIRNEIRRIGVLIGKTPTMHDFKSTKTNISLHQIIYFYGSWNEAVKDAGLEINPTFQPPLYKVPKQELIDEFIKVANEIGAIPGMNVFRSKSKFSWTPYKTTFGSWANAVKYIIDNYKNKFTFKAENKERNNGNNGNRKLLKFSCPLVNIPQNEFETIVLFSYLAPKLGYMIEMVRAEFPDAILIKEGKKINCEFEYLSSNYIQHGHPQDGSCICICWRKDIDINNIEVFSLEEYLRENNWFNK